MSQACVGWRGEIGAYIVGALDAGASAGVRRHLQACPTCRAEYEDLVPVREWLTRLTPADGSAHGRQPGGPALRPVGSVWHRTGRRWLAAAAAGIAAAAVAVLATVGGNPVPPAFQAADRVTGVHGQARLHATAAGTQIDLTVTGLPADEHCVLVAVSAQGTDVAATWSATYDGTARITGTSAIPENHLTALRVESNTRHLLLSIKLGPGPHP